VWIDRFQSTREAQGVDQGNRATLGKVLAEGYIKCVQCMVTATNMTHCPLKGALSLPVQLLGAQFGEERVLIVRGVARES